jgi:hypothetical protein
MHFHQQTIGADGDGGARKRRNQAALTGGVAGVKNYRQVRKLVEGRDGGDVAGVAGGRFKGADSALAQDDVGIAVRHDVFSGHQQLS